MRKIINKKLYDTDTAVQVGDPASPEGMYNVTDFHYYDETLYRKKTGEYFLFGKGGPLSPYAEPYEQHGSQSGQRIIPLTLEQARDWAEEHIDAAEYELEFGTPEEDDSHHVMTITVTEGTYRAIRAIATEHDCMMGDVVDAAIAAYRGNTTAQ